MSTIPISLRRPVRTTQYDDAGVAIVKYVLPPPIPRPPEEDVPNPDDYRGVPSLSYFCVKHLVRYYDQLPVEAIRLHYRGTTTSGFDLLHTLVPNCRTINPSVWTTLIQLFDGLPEELYQISLPLSHPIVPTLQRLPTTPHFSLITVLDLRGAGLVKDDSVVELKELHTLVALDLSDTNISSYAVQVLSGSLSWTQSEPKRRRGPWFLRMLRLRGCKAVDDTVFRYLSNFPLLSVTDLRQTRCSKMAAKKSGFQASTEKELYYPFPIQSSFDTLRNAWPDRFAEVKPFELHIGQIEAPTSTFVTIPKRTCGDPLLSGDLDQKPAGTKGFYFTASSLSSTPHSDITKRDRFWHTVPEYRGPSAPDSEISSRHYDAFMLFREPPPLATLPLPPHPKPISLNKNTDLAAVVNHSGGKFAGHIARLDGLRETKRKRVASDAMPTFPDGFSPTPIGRSKKVNPFRRQSIPALMETLTNSTTKQLKPISQLPPPVFDGLLPNKPKKKQQTTLDNLFGGRSKGATEEKRGPTNGKKPAKSMKKVFP